MKTVTINKEKAMITNMPKKGTKPGKANKKASAGKMPSLKKGGGMNKKGC